MKYLLVLFVLSSAVSGFSQSKKEQIEALTLRVDSLLRVVQQERKTNTDKSNQISSLQSQITALTSQVKQLQLDVSYLDGDLQNKKQTITEQQALLRVKTDSLALLTAELNKLKPAPPVVQPIQTQGNTVSTTTNNTNIKTVTIGTQVWMTTNLNVDKFRNGDPIPEAKTAEEWERAGRREQPAWCYYENNTANGTTYGKLYNWYAVNDPRGLAPEGFHVPSYNEWTTLETFLGDKEGKKMKSKSGWDNYEVNIECTNCKNWSNEYRMKMPCHVCKDTRVKGKKTVSGNGSNTNGFSGLPGGYCDIYGTSYGIGKSGFWWTSSHYNTGLAAGAYSRGLNYDDDLPISYEYHKAKGLAVRCLRD
jgi:uncharacterized protein (TIGR02145 family)